MKRLQRKTKKKEQDFYAIRKRVYVAIAVYLALFVLFLLLPMDGAAPATAPTGGANNIGGANNTGGASDTADAGSSDGAGGQIDSPQEQPADSANLPGLTLPPILQGKDSQGEPSQEGAAPASSPIPDFLYRPEASASATLPQAPLNAQVQSFVQGCRYVGSEELARDPSRYLGHSLIISGRIVSLEEAGGAVTATVLPLAEGAAPVYAPLPAESGGMGGFRPGLYMTLYGIFQNQVEAGGIYFPVQYFVAYQPEGISGLNSRFLQGKWSPDPSSEIADDGLSYEFNGNHLVVHEHSRGKRARIYDGEYAFPAEGRLQLSYTITIFDPDTQQNLGVSAGRVQYPVEIITRNMIVLNGEMVYRIA